MNLEMSSVKWLPFCLGLNVLTHGGLEWSHVTSENSVIIDSSNGLSPVWWHDSVQFSSIFYFPQYMYLTYIWAGAINALVINHSHIEIWYGKTKFIQFIQFDESNSHISTDINHKTTICNALVKTKFKILVIWLNSDNISWLSSVSMHTCI